MRAEGVALQGCYLTPDPVAGRDKSRTKLPGAILDSACAGPEGVSPRDGASNPQSARFSLPGARVARVTAASHPGTFTCAEFTDEQNE